MHASGWTASACRGTGAIEACLAYACTRPDSQGPPRAGPVSLGPVEHALNNLEPDTDERNNSFVVDTEGYENIMTVFVHSKSRALPKSSRHVVCFLRLGLLSQLLISFVFCKAVGLRALKSNICIGALL